MKTKKKKKNENKIYKTVKELKNLVKQNDENQRSSDQPKISEQPEFVNREHFGAGTRNGRSIDFFFNNNASQLKKEESTRRKK